jgi:hypothetical protein
MAGKEAKKLRATSNITFEFEWTSEIFSKKHARKFNTQQGNEEVECEREKERRERKAGLWIKIFY